MSGAGQKYIDAAQIRAGRAILNWSQDDLARGSKLSIATIRNLELGHISPRGKTTQLIRKAFEEAGLEFLDPSGVRMKPENIMVYQGAEGAREFCDDVYRVACEKGGEIVQVWDASQSIFEIIGDYRVVHFERMAKVAGQISVKCILTEIFDFVPASYCQYRSLSKHYVNSVPFYVYGSKYAIILFGDNPKPRIIVIDSRIASDAFRLQFASMWDKAAIFAPPQMGGHLKQPRKK